MDTDRTGSPRLGHVHLKVRDIDSALEFYRDIVGLKVTERVGRHFAFLSFGKAHHDIALQAIGDRAEPSRPNTVGLYHTAFELGSAAELAGMLDRLDAADIPYAAVDHGISWAVYTADTDGNGVEFYIDRRAAFGGAREWHGVSSELSRDQLREAAQI